MIAMDPSVFEKKVWGQLSKLDLPNNERKNALDVLCGRLPDEAYLTSNGKAIEVGVVGDLLIKSRAG